ncbi:MAG: 16S rRNA (cytosine(967)-C(5))-methyltransferase RsmB [Pseudomonadota bacterium]
MANTRALAAQTLVRVIDNRQNLKTAMRELPAELSAQDSGFVQELTYGVCRWYFALGHIVSTLVSKPIKAKDNDIKYLMMIGLYQIIHLSTPDHAAVKETVEGAVLLKKSWARGFLNGCLRTAVRDKAKIIHEQHEAKISNQPDWFFASITKDWPTQSSAILAAYNERPPMTLRVNPAATSRDSYLQQLEQREISARPTTFSEFGIVLQQPVAPETLVGFHDGVVSVQDEAAQFAATLLAPGKSDYVLDACAAPGGKACHLLELNNDINFTALDISEDRLSLVRDNFARQGLKGSFSLGDAREIESWWDGVQFDRILVDAPCSATGVLRRQPDVKLHRQADDISQLSQLQAQILDALWRTLKPGGSLLYATCSILKQENDEVIADFLRTHGNAEAINLETLWGTPTQFGRQTLPGEQDMDGFYYAMLAKSVLSAVSN